MCMQIAKNSKAMERICDWTHVKLDSMIHLYLDWGGGGILCSYHAISLEASGLDTKTVRERSISSYFKKAVKLYELSSSSNGYGTGRPERSC